MAAETRKGFAFGNPDREAADGWGAIITPDELRYVHAFGSPLVAPDGQTITDETLQWYIDNAVGWVMRDLDYWFYKRKFVARAATGQTRDDDLPDLSALKIQYNSAGGSGTAATVTVANGVLSTTITGETGDNLSLTLSDYGSMALLVTAINAKQTQSTNGYTATLLGKSQVDPEENLKDLSATDIYDTEATLTASQEEGVDYFWEEPYDYDRTQYQNFIYIKLNRGPVISVEKSVFRDPTGGLVIDLTTDTKVNNETGSLEFYPSAGLISIFPQFFTPYGHRLLTGAYGEKFPDAFFVDYTTGFRSAKRFRTEHPELFQVVGKLAAINLLADYGDGRTAGLASSSVGLSGLSESFSTTMSATSAFYGARIKQFYEDLKFFYERNRNKYRGIFLGAL